MNKKKILEIMAIVGSITGLIGVLYQGMIDNKEWERTKADWEVMDRGEALSDQYQQASSDFLDKKIPEQEYVRLLKILQPQFEEHLDEIDNRLWQEDAILHRKWISNDLDLIKREISLYGK